jgi:hypothetical protein
VTDRGWLTHGVIDKCKSIWVMKLASTKSRRRMMASWHLVKAEHTSTWEIQMASVKSRRKAKASSLAEVGYASTLISHA